jgi:hypothetical protein
MHRYTDCVVIPQVYFHKESRIKIVIHIGMSRFRGILCSNWVAPAFLMQLLSLLWKQTWLNNLHTLRIPTIHPNSVLTSRCLITDPNIFHYLRPQEVGTNYLNCLALCHDYNWLIATGKFLFSFISTVILGSAFPRGSDHILLSDGSPSDHTDWLTDIRVFPLALASTIIPGSESHWTHRRILHPEGSGSLQNEFPPLCLYHIDKDSTKDILCNKVSNGCRSRCPAMG